jgi:hypothetical protein
MRSWLLALGFFVSATTLLSAQSSFTDDPLVTSVTVAKAVHVTELRTRINSVRATCGLAAATWTDPALAATVTVINAVHVSEMRTSLTAAYTGCGRTAPTYTDPTLTATVTVIKAVHISELRAAVVALEAGAQSAVNLGTAGTFVILTKSGITDVPTSAVVGDVGASPITGAAILLTCSEVTGNIYAVDAAGPEPCSQATPTTLTVAVGDMQIAYEDAKGRSSPNFIDLGAGEIGGRTLAPGLYKWNTNLLMSNDVTLVGSANDVWIFQVSGTLTQSNGKQVLLSGGALPKNIFWQVTEAVDIGTSAHFEGIILGQTQIAMKTGASMNGRLFAQTAVTLQSNTVTKPAP